MAKGNKAKELSYLENALVEAENNYNKTIN